MRLQSIHSKWVKCQSPDKGGDCADDAGVGAFSNPSISILANWA
jgi:hypothetical protein